MKDMVLKWSQSLSCKWMVDEKVIKEIFEEMNKGSILAPISIRSFANRTKEETNLRK